MKGISSFIYIWKEAMNPFIAVSHPLTHSFNSSLSCVVVSTIIYVRNWIWLTNEIIFHLLFLFLRSLLILLTHSLIVWAYVLLLLFFFDFNDLLIPSALLLLLSFHFPLHSSTFIRRYFCAIWIFAFNFFYFAFLPWCAFVRALFSNK